MRSPSSRWRRWLWAAGIAAALALYYFSIFPSNNRDWSPDQTRLPQATFDGRMVLLNNIRDITYRSESDYTPDWHDAAYDLALAAAFERALGDIPHARIGEAPADARVRIDGRNKPLVDADTQSLKEAWQKPLRW